jgi:hypothetical protein
MSPFIFREAEKADIPAMSRMRAAEWETDFTIATAQKI